VKKRFKRWIDCLKSKTKNLLKQRLDFPLQKKIETMGRLAKMHGQEIDETTVGFSISRRN